MHCQATKIIKTFKEPTSTVNTMSSLLLGPKSDGGLQADDGGFALLQAGFSDGVGDRGKITTIFITSLNPYCCNYTHESPLLTCRTCHPYARNRCSTFSVKATAVSPSIEMSNHSYF